jgi:Leucine-rich repeat (LRR) protein
VPVVAPPAPVLIVVDAVVVPSAAEISTAAVQAVATVVAAPVDEKSTVVTAAPVADISVVDPKFIDPNQMVVPCSFVYTAPEPSVYNANGIPIAVDVKVVQEPRPVVAQCVVVQGGGPSGEVTIDYSDSDETTTDVWVSEKMSSAVNCMNATHLNLWNNDVAVIQNLEKFPNLMRLTLRSNEIKSLYGLGHGRNLRWVDVSDNDLKDLHGVEGMQSLEWLDLHNNEFKTMEGLTNCPRLTFLNMRFSDLRNLKGVETLKSLRYLDVGGNDLTTISELRHCVFLTEVNLNNNNLKSSTEIMVLAHLPYLARIDISNNKLDIQKIVDYFKKVNPACKMVVNAKKAVNDNAVGVGTNQITYKKASTSSDDGCCQIV